MRTRNTTSRERSAAAAVLAASLGIVVCVVAGWSGGCARHDRVLADGRPIAGVLPGPEELTPGVIGDILRDDPRFASFSSDPAKWRLQVVVSEIMPPDDTHETPWIRRYGYRVDEEYFYPASTVKLLAAAAALETIGEMAAPTPQWSIAFDPAFNGQQRESSDPSNIADQTITLEHEIRKLFLVSDNRAFNRLYDIVGHRELNERSWRAGLPSVRLTHRLSIARTAAQNRITRRSVLTDPHDPARTVTVPERDSGLSLTNEGTPGLVVGTAQIAGGQRIEEPKDFTRSNRVSLIDLHNATISIVRPDIDTGAAGFQLQERDRALLLDAMTGLPGDSTNPVYPRVKYPDDWGKFMLEGIRRAMPADSIRYTNKIGLAYGFTTETAYIEDIRTGRAFFVTATLYTNANATLNDNVYEYDSVAMPFWKNLGEALARRLLLDQGSWAHERTTAGLGPAGWRANGATEAVLSFNARVPEGSGVEGQIRVRPRDRAWSPWFTLATWGITPSPANETPSETLTVAIDELRSKHPLTEVEVRATTHTTGPSEPPAVHRLDATLSRLDPTRSVLPSAGAPLAVDTPFRTLDAAEDLASRLCSPTSLSMLLAHRGVAPKPREIIASTHDARHDLYGVWPTNIQAAFVLGAPGYLARFSDWQEVRRHLEETGPIAISITAEEGEVRNLGYTSGGHLLVLTGLTSRGDALVLDPAYSCEREARRVLPARDLSRVWLQRKRGTAYVLLPRAGTD